MFFVGVPGESTLYWHQRDGVEVACVVYLCWNFLLLLLVSCVITMVVGLVLAHWL